MAAKAPKGTTIKGDVGIGVFVSGAPNDDQFAIVMDELRFFEMTGMRTSAPERIALLCLMRENVSSHQLSKVWKDELQFVDDAFVIDVRRWLPFFAFAVWMAMTGCFVGIYLAAPRWDLAGVFFGAMVALLGYFAVLVGSDLTPYYIARKIRPTIENVNRMLPMELARWRASLGGG